MNYAIRVDYEKLQSFTKISCSGDTYLAKTTPTRLI